MRLSTTSFKRTINGRGAPRALRWRFNDAWVFALADQAICSGANFSSGIIVARNCAPAQFGTYLLAFSLLLVLIDIQAALIWTPYTIKAPVLGPDERVFYTGSAAVHQVLLGIAVSALLAASAVTLGFTRDPNNYAGIAKCLALAAPAIIFREGARRISFALLRFRTAFFTDCFISVAQVLVLLYLASSRAISGTAALNVSGAAAAIGLSLWLVSMRKEIRVGRSDVRSHFAANWSTGRWIFASGVVWTLLTNVYPWILSVLKSNATAAEWGACIGITASCNPLLLGLQNYIGPRIAHAYAKGGTRGLSTASIAHTIRLCAALLPFTVVLLLAGGAIVGYVYGSSYGDNGVIVAILGLNVLAAAGAFAPSRALFSLGKARLDAMLNLVALGLTLSVSVMLIKLYGMIGAACGLTSINLCLAILRHALVLRHGTGNTEAVECAQESVLTA